jgi:flavorubredoxin
MSVQLTDDIRWLNECYDVDGRHLHISVFLITHDNGTALVDTGSYYHSQSIRDELTRLVGENSVDTVFLSNPDYVHSGNVSLFLEVSDVVCFVGTPERHGYAGAITADPGDSIDVGNRTFSFIDPIVSDIASSVWIYDHGSGSLFTSDGLGQYHAPDACDCTSEDLGSVGRFRDVRDFHHDTLRWLQYVDPAAIEAAVTKVFDAYDVRRILPAHGHPIVEEDVPQFLDSFHRAIHEIVKEE